MITTPLYLDLSLHSIRSMSAKSGHNNHYNWVELTVRGGGHDQQTINLYLSSDHSFRNIAALRATRLAEAINQAIAETAPPPPLTPLE